MEARYATNWKRKLSFDKELREALKLPLFWTEYAFQKL